MQTREGRTLRDYHNPIEVIRDALTVYGIIAGLCSREKEEIAQVQRQIEKILNIDRMAEFAELIKIVDSKKPEQQAEKAKALEAEKASHEEILSILSEDQQADQAAILNYYKSQMQQELKPTAKRGKRGKKS
ncbi:MAG: hypothetical protein QG610_643 [Euryarchaeota archaeon]|nr:hypothetical protein [Euryarchaeota archaeon]